MDLFLHQIRAAYRQHRAYLLWFGVLTAVIGVMFGYRFIGPALFG
jgi:hypothetical protein